MPSGLGGWLDRGDAGGAEAGLSEHQLGNLAGDRGQVAADLLGDLTIRAAGRDEHEDAPFVLGQRGPTRTCLDEVLLDALPDLGIDELLAGADGPDSADEVDVRCCLDRVSGGPGDDRCETLPPRRRPPSTTGL